MLEDEKNVINTIDVLVDAVIKVIRQRRKQ